MDTIRLGSNGDDVKVWQSFIGLKATGVFDSVTDAATRVYQTSHRLKSDGIVGAVTWLAMQSASAYPRPNFTTLTRPDRASRFGAFQWEDADNDGWIEIQGDWVKRNIVRLEIPELESNVVGWKGHDLCHREALAQIQGFFRSVNEAGLIDRVKSWGGCWAPRRIRTTEGFSPNLSTHSWGIAFDINAIWNQLGHKPAVVGEEGSVIELLTIAYKFGLYWGGLFSSQDGMHFEIGATA